MTGRLALFAIVTSSLAAQVRPAAAPLWKPVHAQIARTAAGLRITAWKGYEETGLETTRLPQRDWRRWHSLRFSVFNPYREPVSVFVRISDRGDHPGPRTYTGGTFDGYVIGGGNSEVQINLAHMQSPSFVQLDARHIAWVGIYFSPLFLRDGQDLRFTGDRIFQLTLPMLSRRSAREQKQPYADLLFANTAPALVVKRRQTEAAIAHLNDLIAQARARGIDTAYQEIYPYLAHMAFQQRLVAFWQDRAAMQNAALDFLLKAAEDESTELREIMAGTRQPLKVVTAPPYRDLRLADGYFRLNGAPLLLYGMDYNTSGPLLRWFANSATDYGTQLIAGATRANVEREPIWKIYQQYPETHRVGWKLADHIVRDASSWEVVGPEVNVCLEDSRSRDAVRQYIENFERGTKDRADALVENLGFEYFYVCYCDTTRHMWADWLVRKHHDIATANALWHTSYASFVSVPMPHPDDRALNRALWFDWASFNLYRFLEQLRWTRDQVTQLNRGKPITVGSPYYAFSPRFWTAVDEEELADSDITQVVLEENYELDTLMPEYLHALAGAKPVADFEFHGVIDQIMPSFLHGDAAISMWWWNDQKHWTPNEPINEWASSFPQSYTIPLSDVAKAMRDSLDLRRLSTEISALAQAPRPVALLYSKASMLQQPPRSSESDSTPYLFYLRQIYNASQAANAYVGITTEKKILAGDLNNRKVLIITATEFMPAEVARRILDWVSSGGMLLLSPDSMLSDEYGRQLTTAAQLGFRLLRREPPRLRRGERDITPYNFSDLPHMSLTPTAGSIASSLSLDAVGARQVIACDSGIVAARFADHNPALLDIKRGKGHIYWLAAPLDPRSWRRLLAAVSEQAGASLPMRVRAADGRELADLEYRVVQNGTSHLAYFYNNTDEAIHFRVTPRFSFSHVIDRRTESRVAGTDYVLPARETAIVEFTGNP